MAYLEDKIQQVQDKELRDILLAEVKKLKKEKKFGLVFEEHVPELVPVFSAPIRPHATVAIKDGDLLETFRVKRIQNGQATVSKDSDGTELVFPASQLVVVQRFGEAIYPSLELKEMVQNGGNRPFHTLIEADNYHALQLLEYLYAGQVDCIYIDPPYNTGARDWKYNNNYVDSNDSWRHSKWLSMMKKRLYLAKNLLSPNGVIFVSIDDDEACHLKLLMDGVFGASQFIGQFVWKSRQNKDNRTKNGASIDHEYVFAYGAALRGVERDYGQFDNPDNDPRGLWTSGNMTGLADEKARPNLHYDLINPATGINYGRPKQGWRFDRNRMASLMTEKRILWPVNPTGRPRLKVFLDEMQSEFTGFSSIIGNQVFTYHGTRELERILGNRAFDFPKPSNLVLELVRQGTPNKNSIVLDFFAGSATTLNAVNLLNASDNGNRQCILVTNNEVTPDEAKTLQEQGFMPGDAEYEKHGICQSVTWPRSKYTILGKRNDGSLLEGDYLTGRTVTKDKRRIFKQLGFIDSQQLTAVRKKELVSLLDGIPQSKLDKDAAFLVDDNCKASVLFDSAEADAYLDALEDMTHIETFYLVTADNALYKRLKETISERLGPLQISEEEKRPMSSGFDGNLAYFKLDFLEADEVQLGRKFAALLPILWLMAGARGPCPNSPADTPYFLPQQSPFAVLLDEHCFLAFKTALQARPDISHVFLTTNSEDGFFVMREELAGHLQVVQLYKNYLDQFKINTQWGRA